MDWEEMKIIDSARDDYRLRIKEMMYINKFKPELNIQKSSQMFSLLLNGGKELKKMDFVNRSHNINLIIFMKRINIYR